MKNTLKIFSGRSNLALAQGIVDVLGMDLGDVTIRTFADGELWVKYEENIRGQDVFIIQSTNEPADNLIELFLLLDAAVRASAQRVTAVIPYFGYGRQDRKDQPRVPISSRVMVDIITTQVQIESSAWICTLPRSRDLLQYHLITFTVAWC